MSTAPGRVLVVIACLLGLAACTLQRPSAPESRAEYFVKKFIFEPQAAEDLRAVAWLGESQDPEALIGDLPTRTSVAYLRVRARLDIELGVRVAGSSAPAADRKLVQVHVTEGGRGGSAVEPVRLEVQLEKREQEWRVTGLRAD